jgi:broad specificity phosphatase PhoE
MLAAVAISVAILAVGRRAQRAPRLSAERMAQVRASLDRAMALLARAEAASSPAAATATFSQHIETIEDASVFETAKTVPDDRLDLLGLAPGATFADFEALFEREKARAAQESANVHVRALYFVRHGEGDHNSAERRLGSEQWENVEAKKPKYLDARLNVVGRRQAERLGVAVRRAAPKIDGIVVSPLTRAIETAAIGLRHVWGSVPVLALEVARETLGKNWCDKRRPLSVLREEFPAVDFRLMDPVEEDPWWTPQRETDAHLQLRVRALMRWILSPEGLGGLERIAVVGHSGFMSNAMHVLGHPPHWPKNCEMVPVVVRVRTL